MEYELIGKTIVIPDNTDKQQVEHTIQKIHTIFNNIARFSYLHTSCGAIRWTWLLTLLVLRKKEIEYEEDLTAYSDVEKHNIRIRICEAEVNVYTSVRNEYVLRKAAKDVGIWIKNMECAGVNPDISVRQIAFDIASRLVLHD